MLLSTLVVVVNRRVDTFIMSSVHGAKNVNFSNLFYASV